MPDLDDLLASWASMHRLTSAQSVAIRAAVVRDAAAVSADDEDWLQDLMRPVTALLDGPHNLFDTLSRPFAKELTRA